MHRPFRRLRGELLLVLSALAGLAGCSTSPGGRFTLFPEGHLLIPPAQDLRAISGPPPGAPRELDKAVAGPYVIEPGDVLLVQPANLDSPVRLPGDQPVLPDGTIQLGRYGRVLVAGKTVEQIEVEVNAVIKGQVADAGAIVVRLVTRDSKVYYVLGEVNAPGSFQFKGRETVLDAIIAAGGLTSGASRKSIILTRPTPPDSCRIVLPVSYYAIVQLGDTTTNYQIKAGDRIYVPSKTLCEDLKACFDKKYDSAVPPVPCHLGGHPAAIELPGKMTTPEGSIFAAPATPATPVPVKPSVSLGPISSSQPPGQLPPPKPADEPPPPDPPGRDNDPLFN
jgi:protein involved in polysaccharide export with SLBB domain